MTAALRSHPRRARSGLLRRWLRHAQWRAQPGRSAASVAAVAIGVALALAIHLVNATALSTFRQALDSINGMADLRITAPSGLLDESALDIASRVEGVAVASPVLDLPLTARRGESGPIVSLRLIATEPFAALRVSPQLVPQATPLRPDHWWLSASAWRLLDLPPPENVEAGDLAATRNAEAAADAPVADTPVPTAGAPAAAAPVAAAPPTGATAATDTTTITAFSGNGLLKFSAAGLASAIDDQPVALMDLGSAQWAFGLVGKLSRVDLRLAPNSNVDQVRAALTAQFLSSAGFSSPPEANADVLPGAQRLDSVQITVPSDDSQRMSNISRAYRVNLNVLALVALVTGGFIVFAAMSLAAVRQQPQFALFTVLGAAPTFSPYALIGQGAAIGLAGAVCGVAAGIALAQVLLTVVGTDLGGGYFEGSRPQLVIDWSVALGFGLLGWLTAVLGALAPAVAVRKLPAMAILRSGALAAIETAAGARRRRMLVMALFVLGLGLALAPPVSNLPVGAYCAIAMVLLGGVLATPSVLGAITALIERYLGPRLWRHPATWLALAHQRRAATSIAIALAGVVASFALCVAMMVMVASFRTSVDHWLGTVLPADWYVRLASGATPVPPPLQQTVRDLAGPSRIEFSRSRQLTLDARAAPVTWLARDAADSDALAARLPLTGALLGAAANAPPSGAATNAPPPSAAANAPHASGSAAAAGSNGGKAGVDLDGFVSEAMVALHGMAPGSVQTLTIDGRPLRLHVRGVWRDYARQGGAIVVARSDYQRLTGDASVTDLALWPAPGVDGTALVARLRAADPLLAAGDWRSAAELRRVSLRIFDRSFAVTHVLVAVAILVGLFGVATSYAAQALTRTREFGMLRHLGAERHLIVKQLAIEASIGASIAVLWGTVLGLAIALILIDRVNPQSFHWTMDLMIPWPRLLAVAAAMVVTATLMAILSTRHASSGEPVAALSRDNG